MSTGKLRYVGYVRVSSARQIDGLSIEAQKRLIQQFVDDRGDGNLIRWYEDIAETAKTTHNRDAYLEMRRDAADHLFDVLVVHKFDRLNRSRIDATTTKFLLRKEYGIKVLSVTEPSLDEDGPIGGLMEGILESVAEWFSQNLSTEVKKARIDMLDKGLWYGPRPFGYQIINGRAVPDEHEAEAIRWMFNAYATGDYSLIEIAKELNKRGYQTVKGHPFRKTAVQFVLQNKAYAGYLRHQETVYDSQGRRKWTQGVSYYKSDHEPIISEELYDQVQAVKDKKRTNRNPNQRALQFLLRKKVFCAACVSLEAVPPHRHNANFGLMTPKVDYVEGQAYRYFRCTEVGHGGYPKAEVIEKELLDLLMSDKLPEAWKNEAIPIVAGALDDKSIEQRVAEITEVVNRMDYRFDHGFITDTEEFQRKRAELQHELAQLKPLTDGTYQEAVDIIYNFPARWAACGDDVEAQIQLIDLIVDKVFIRNKHVEAVLFKPDYKYLFPGY